LHAVAVTLLGGVSLPRAPRTGWKACATMSQCCVRGVQGCGWGVLAPRPPHRLESLCHRHLVHNVHPVHYVPGTDRSEKGRGCGLWHAFVHRGFSMQARRKRMPSREDAKRARAIVGRHGRELATRQAILFLPAWQLVAVQKACQSPHAPARCHPAFPHRCATMSQCCVRSIQDCGRGVPAPRRGKSRAPNLKSQTSTKHQIQRTKPSETPWPDSRVWGLGLGIRFLFGAWQL